MFKELDQIIQDHSVTYRQNGPDDVDTEIDDNKYDMLKAEIELHIQGKKKFLELSKEAQEIVEEWERYERELRGIPNINPDAEEDR